MRDIDNYIASYKRLLTEPMFERTYYQPSDNKDEIKYSNFLTSASAAMTQLLPQMTFQEQQKLLNRLGQYLRIQRQDEGIDLRQITRIDGDLSAVLSPGPKIICTFHYGSFRYLPYFLFLEKKNFAMLLTELVIKEQGGRYANIAKYFNGNSVPSVMVNAQSWISMVKCLDFLKRGGSLLAYVDGNSGIEGEVLRTDRQMIPIPFLGGEIYVRLGVFLLSYLSKIPITIVVNDIISPDERVLKIYEPIKCEHKDDAKNVMIKIYGTLAEHIKKDIAQWEGWLYYRTYINASRTPPSPNHSRRPIFGDKPLRFNHERFGVIRDNDGIELIDKITLGTRKLKNHTYLLLNKIIYAEKPIKFEELCARSDIARRTTELLYALDVVVFSQV